MVSTRQQCHGLPPFSKTAEKEGKGKGNIDKIGDSLPVPKHNLQTRISPFTANKTEPLSRGAKLTSSTQSGDQRNCINTDSSVGVNNKRETKRRRDSSGHFLEGIDLEHVDDALSIPDPPSPNSLPFARRHSASSAESVRPLREISNASDAEDDGDTFNTNNTNVTTRRRKTRSKRKTMMPLSQPSLVSSQRESLDESTPVFSTPHQPTSNSTKPKLWRNLDEPSSKRRKKRQSLVLPSDVEPSERNSDEFTQAYASFKNDPSPPATPVTETKTPSRPPMDALHQLRELVHEFTSIPKDKRSAKSSPAKEILARTGYPLTCSVPTSGTVATDLSQEQKLAFFCRIGPQLKQMDACKVSDAKMVEEVTQCKSQKARGGYYRYFHGETGRPVRPEEFQERYLMMLEEVNHIRSTAWLEYFDSLRDKRSQICLEVDASKEHVVKASMLSDRPSLRRGSCNCTGSAHQVSESPDELRAGNADSSACNSAPFPGRHEVPSDPILKRGNSNRTGSTHQGTKYADQSILSNDVLQTPVHKDKSSFVQVSRGQGNDQHDAVELREENADSSASVSVPLPDRDEVSSDPIVAKAERKLWDAIDKALAEYSRDIMAARGVSHAVATPSRNSPATATPQTPVHC